MGQPNLSFNCADVARTLSHYTVGFAAFTRKGNIEDAVPAGSGTLVRVGGVKGIVTARHVIEALQRRDETALLRFPLRSDTILSHRIDLGHAEFLILPGTDGPDGPDLGFMRSPLVTEETLVGTNSFYPLDAPRPPMKGSYRGLGMVDLLLGIVAEWTTDVERKEERRRKEFMLLSAGGFDGNEREHAGFDLATFTPDFASGKDPPRSYAGVSGGGIWRVFFKPDGSNKVEHRRLVGTAFYEFEQGDGVTRIIHHGPSALEQRLLPAVRERWPDAAQG